LYTDNFTQLLTARRLNEDKITWAQVWMIGSVKVIGFSCVLKAHAGDPWFRLEGFCITSLGLGLMLNLSHCSLGLEGARCAGW
jgi:hypothetical protein